MVAQGYRDALDRPVIGRQALEGMADTLALLTLSIQSELGADDSSGRIAELRISIETLCTDPPSQLADVISRLRSLAVPSTELMEAIKQVDVTKIAPLRRADESLLGPIADTVESQSGYWSRQLKSQVDAWLEVVDRYLPRFARLEAKGDASQTRDRLETGRVASASLDRGSVTAHACD